MLIGYFMIYAEDLVRSFILMCDVNFLGSFVPVFDVGNLLSSCNGGMHTRSGQTNLHNRSRVVHHENMPI